MTSDVKNDKYFNRKNNNQQNVVAKGDKQQKLCTYYNKYLSKEHSQTNYKINKIMIMQKMTNMISLSRD